MVNIWTEKSLELANSPGYLDKLSNVYKMRINPERPLPEKAVEEIKRAFIKKDDEVLIKLLIDYPKVFPVKDSYVGFLRAKPEAIKENPKTVKRIAERLYALGIDKTLLEATRPIETNRQLGNSFREWLHKIGYKVVDEQTLINSQKGTFILNGGDSSLFKFATQELGCELRKGIDLVIKKNKDYIIGEAKFLTTPGGEQDRGFDDAKSFVTEKSGNAQRIGIIDGYIWLTSLTGLHNKIIKSNENIISALILHEFIESF